MSDALTDLQAAIKTFLDGTDYFSDAGAGTPKPITIVTEDEKDISSRINTVVGQATGIMVLIVTPGGDVKNPDVVPHVYEPATVVLRVFEKPTINRGANGTGQPGGKVADAIMRLLGGEILTVGDVRCLIYGTGRHPGNDTRFQTFDVFFETTIALSTDAPTRA